MAQAQGFTTDQLVTLASMVEKEAGQPNDFFYVSEVFRNRLKSPGYFPFLQSDATVLYEIHHETGTRPKHVTHEDTELPVPYNTYTNQGLPPGPISNPSATAMLAAIREGRFQRKPLTLESVAEFQNANEVYDAEVAEQADKADPDEDPTGAAPAEGREAV